MMRTDEPWGISDWAKALVWTVIYALYGRLAVIFANRTLLRAGLGRDIGWVPDRRDVLLGLVIVFAWQHVGTLLHELGHAVTAWATGEGVRAIELGRGRRRWHGHVGAGPARVCITVRVHAGEGRTVVRRRVPGLAVMVAAGGPMADLVTCLMIGVPVAGELIRRPEPGIGWGLELLALIAVFHGRSFLSNAIPRRAGNGYNDGAKIFLRTGRRILASASDTPFDRWKAAVRRSETGDVSAAVDMAYGLLAGAAPGTKLEGEARLMLALVLARGGRFAEAIEQISLTDPKTGDMSPAARETVLADLVLSDGVVNGTHLDAERLTSLARAIDPDREPAVCHTHALWLLAAGQAGAAAAEAQRALREAPVLQPMDRAAVCATVAIALARCGDHSQARTWLDDVPLWSPWRAAAARAVDRAAADVVD
jgi:Peptidase M50B-like